MRAFLVAACLLLSGTVSAQTPLPSVPLPPDLDRVLRDYETSWAKKDAAGLAGLFAEDGFVLQGGRPPIRGRAAIQGAYAGSGGPLSLRALAFAVEGPVGYIIGAYAAKAGDPDDGKFTLTLRKGADGKWLIFSDMDNGSRPRPGPPPPSPTPKP
ncbi:MAG: nuclear transport factor 2 family protein [Acidobacteria bacterium]|nr:nuclear transport factor 2 family protein [Acidobacteriota bacterium]